MEKKFPDKFDILKRYSVMLEMKLEEARNIISTIVYKNKLSQHDVKKIAELDKILKEDVWKYL